MVDTGGWGVPMGSGDAVGCQVHRLPEGESSAVGGSTPTHGGLHAGDRIQMGIWKR